MEQDAKPNKRSYDKYGFSVQEKEDQAINYLIDSDAQEQRLWRWQKLLPQIKQLRQGGKQSQRKLLNYVRKGVQDSLRQQVWPQIIYKPIKSFEQCKDKIDLKEVTLDLDRTFPNHKQAKSIGQRMKIVLNAIAYAFPKVGYCQGMNFIVGTLLLKLTDQQAFNVACHIIHWQKHEQLLTNLSLIHQKLYALDKLINKHYPKLFKHLKGHEIDSILFAPSWFITLYCNSLPASYAFRILQCFIMEGEKVVYRVALQILKMKKHALKSLNKAEKIIDELKNFDELLEPKIDTFFDGMYKLNLSRTELNFYTAQYRQFQYKKKVL